MTSLAKARLVELDLYGTGLFRTHIEKTASAWPGCVITMPDGAIWRVPTK